MGNLRTASNYLKRITLYDLAHLMSMTNHIVFGVEILKIDSWCCLEKEVTKLIRMNRSLVLCWDLRSISLPKF